MRYYFIQTPLNVLPMKKALIIISLAFLASSISAQDECTPKKLEAGFDVGVNYSILQAGEQLPSPYFIDNSAGFQFALNLEWNLLKSLSLQPALGVSINNSRVTNEYNYLYSNPSSYNIFPVALESALKARYYPFQGTNKPFITAGLLYMHPLEESYSSSQFTNSGTFAIDFGIGIENSFFGKLNFSPEIRYTLGLSNVNKNPALKDLSYNRIAVIIGIQ